MSTFVLVHGAWHGGWCWYKILPLLEQQGHTAVALDLPSHGRDRTPVASVSLQTYVDRVCSVVDAQREPVVLVGHSMGGATMTQVAEHRPQKIKTLVYLAAFLLRNGESVIDIQDPESLVLPNAVFSEDRSCSTMKDEALEAVFYGDCAAEDIALARLLLGPQAMAPAVTPVTTTETNFGRVPRVYIECLRDRAVSPSVQRRMYTALPCRKVISLRTDHSPFFSAPQELVRHLTAL